jgi:anti-anti-sigma regulatory factor
VVGVSRGDDAALGVAVIMASGDNDAYEARLLDEALDDIRPGPVLVDLAPATFVDSTFVGALIAASRTMPLAVVLPADRQNAVVKLFELAHLGEALALHSSRADALAALSAAPR